MYIDGENMRLEITKSNIAEVLKFNKISNWVVETHFKKDKNCIALDAAYEVITNGDMDIHLDNPNWLAHLEIETGKLKALPQFDFFPYFAKSGFDFNHDPQYQTIEIITKQARIYSSCKQSSENADVLLKVANILNNELK